MKIADDRMVFGKVCLLLLADMPFLYAKKVKGYMIMKLIYQKRECLVWNLFLKAQQRHKDGRFGWMPGCLSLIFFV